MNSNNNNYNDPAAKAVQKVLKLRRDLEQARKEVKATAENAENAMKNARTAVNAAEKANKEKQKALKEITKQMKKIPQRASSRKIKPSEAGIQFRAGVEKKKNAK